MLWHVLNTCLSVLTLSESLCLSALTFIMIFQWITLLYAQLATYALLLFMYNIIHGAKKIHFIYIKIPSVLEINRVLRRQEKAWLFTYIPGYLKITTLILRSKKIWRWESLDKSCKDNFSDTLYYDFSLLVFNDIKEYFYYVIYI